MNKRNAILIALIIALAAPVIATSQEAGRVALFQIGAGPGFPSYPSTIESVFSAMESSPGVDRVKVSFDIALGFAVSQQSYFMIRGEGLGDRFYDALDYIQMNLLLYSLGLRYYPSTTGVYIEAGAGASRGAMASSSVGESASDFGFGYGAALGYDLNTKPRGFGLCLEARYLGLTIEDEQTGGLMLTLNLCWK